MSHADKKTFVVEVNGQTVQAREGETILELVRRHRLDEIPTLCHDERLHPFASCFVCVVEVKGLDRLIPSCSTPVAEGMSITTRSPRIEASRKDALSLLLSDHFADCLGPCREACPAGVDAQAYVALVSRGAYQEALDLIRARNPLPLSIGRVCVRDCENACRRALEDEAVAINMLKRFVADRAFADGPEGELLPPPSGKRVAIVGGGPSGLTCAYYLKQKGHAITLYEKNPKLGGMLRYGIPEYRLPKATLDAEIDWLLSGGRIEVRTGADLGKNLTLQDLRDEGYDAIYLALGAWSASTMRLEGEGETEGVSLGIDFLARVAEGEITRLEGPAVIVGGGNTALDAARTAIRLGASPVSIVYRRSIKEMPAHRDEVDAARHEGIQIHFLTNPVGLEREGNKLTGVVCLRMVLADDPQGGRPRPVPQEWSEHSLPCATLIGAIGQGVDTGFYSATPDLELTRWGTVVVNPGTMATNLPGVFAGGDMVEGPWSAIGAIAHGGRAAHILDRFLETGEVSSPPRPFTSQKKRFREVGRRGPGGVTPMPRVRMPELNPEERAGHFQEVELGLGQEQVCGESQRCLSCGCSAFTDCELRHWADVYQADPTPYLGAFRDLPVDASHPRLILEINKCIQCGRCVRTCDEGLGIGALGFVRRGFETRVRPALERPLGATVCISCGNCLDVCPTGAISENRPGLHLGSTALSREEGVCDRCSLSCDLELVVRPGGLISRQGSERFKETLSRGYLCGRGHFAPGSQPSQARIGGAAASPQAAWEEIQSRLDETVAREGAGRVGLLVSGHLNAATLWGLQDQLRRRWKSDAADTLAWGDRWLGGASLSVWGNWLAPTVGADALNRAGRILVVLDRPSPELIVLQANLRAQAERGCRIHVVAPDGVGRAIPGTRRDLDISALPETLWAMAEGHEAHEGFEVVLTLVSDPRILLAACALARRLENEGGKGVWLPIWRQDSPVRLGKLGVLSGCLPGAGRREDVDKLRVLSGEEQALWAQVAPPAILAQELQEGHLSALIVAGQDPWRSPRWRALLERVPQVYALTGRALSPLARPDILVPLRDPDLEGGWGLDARGIWTLRPGWGRQSGVADALSAEALLGDEGQSRFEAFVRTQAQGACLPGEISRPHALWKEGWETLR